MERSPGLIASVLGVRPDEVERVRGLVGASFLLGTALVLFYGSANAIFLTRYDVTVLPWVYISNAVAVIVVGLVYGAWSARVPAGRVLVGLAASMTISVAVLWAWAALSDDRIVAFAMAMWFRLLFIFAVLGLWEIASEVFDIRQAKRLFAAVALGMMLAFVVGGTATPMLSSLLGTVSLVGVAAICFAAYTVDFRRLLRRYQVGAGGDSIAVAPAGPAEILADRYSRRMVWMKSVTILLLYVTEYVFYEQAAGTFRTEASLAGFLGVFMGVMTIVMVVVTGVFSGRYISRFGIRTATLTLPVGMLLVAVAAGVYGTVVAVDTIFFAFVCVALATDHVLGNAIGEPAGAVLFQPMPAARRMRVRLAVDGWLGSAALVFSGLLLLAFNAAALDSVAPFLFLVAGIAGAGIVVAILQYRDYVGALRSATTLGFADDVATTPLDPLDRAFLTDGLGSDDPGAVLATAGMIRSLAAEPLRPVLPGLVGHRAADVVDLALDAIAETGDRSHAALVEEALNREDLPPATRSRALTTLAVLDPARASALTRAVLEGQSSEVALGAALTDPALRTAALERLLALAGSDEAANRVAACRIIEAAPVDVMDDETLLMTLLRDPDPDVVDAALGAATGRVSAQVAREVVRCATTPAHGRRAIGVLATGGPTVADALDDVLPSLPDDMQADVIRRVLAKHHDSATIARRWLAPDTPSVVRRAGYQALADTRATVSIRDPLAADLELLVTVVSAHRDVADTAPVVRDALREEFDLARQSIYAALGVEYDARRLRDIETLVRTGDEEDRANAIEALDVVLAADHRRPIIAALEPLDVVDASTSLPDLPAPGSADERLRALRADRRLTPWTRRVVADHLDHPTRPDGGSAMDPTIARVLSLLRVEIFSTLPYESLVELAQLVRTHSVAPGAVIIEDGSVGRELYALVSGEVEVRTRDGNVSHLEEGTVFGELAILDPAPRSATVTAVTPVELIVVSRSTVLALADRRPSVMAEIARVLARRLRAVT